MERTRLSIGGRFHWYCLDRFGQTKWSGFLTNGVTTEGVNECLNRMFTGTAQTSWWMGLIDQSGFSAVSAADTHASHTGWSEFTGYSGSRPLWNPVAASGGVMTTGVGSSFVITAAGTLRGAFLASRTATGTGSGAVLYCTAITLSTATVAVAIADVITVTYVCRITGS